MLTRTGLLLVVGAILGSAVLYTGLHLTGRLDARTRTAVDSLDVTLRQEDLRATTPTSETVYDSTDVDTVVTVIPSFLVGEDSGRDTSRARDSVGAAPDAPAPGLPPTDPVRPVRPQLTGVNAYWLPLVDGVPAVTVTEDETRVQVYSPIDTRGRVFRYDHPHHTVTVAPVGGIELADRFRLRLGVEVDLRISPGTVRLQGGIDPLPPDPFSPYFGVVVRPFSVSFL